MNEKLNGLTKLEQKGKYFNLVYYFLDGNVFGKPTIESIDLSQLREKSNVGKYKWEIVDKKKKEFCDVLAEPFFNNLGKKIQEYVDRDFENGNIKKEEYIDILEKLEEFEENRILDHKNLDPSEYRTKQIKRFVEMMDEGFLNLSSKDCNKLYIDAVLEKEMEKAFRKETSWNKISHALNFTSPKGGKADVLKSVVKGELNYVSEEDNIEMSLLKRQDIRNTKLGMEELVKDIDAEDIMSVQNKKQLYKTDFKTLKQVGSSIRGMWLEKSAKTTKLFKGQDRAHILSNEAITDYFFNYKYSSDFKNSSLVPLDIYDDINKTVKKHFSMKSGNVVAISKSIHYLFDNDQKVFKKNGDEIKCCFNLEWENDDLDLVVRDSKGDVVDISELKIDSTSNLAILTNKLYDEITFTADLNYTNELLTDKNKFNKFRKLENLFNTDKREFYKTMDEYINQSQSLKSSKLISNILEPPTIDKNKER